MPPEDLPLNFLNPLDLLFPTLRDLDCLLRFPNNPPELLELPGLVARLTELGDRVELILDRSKVGRFAELNFERSTL